MGLVLQGLKFCMKSSTEIKAEDLRTGNRAMSLSGAAGGCVGSEGWQAVSCPPERLGVRCSMRGT